MADYRQPLQVTMTRGSRRRRKDYEQRDLGVRILDAMTRIPANAVADVRAALAARAGDAYALAARRPHRGRRRPGGRGGVRGAGRRWSDQQLTTIHGQFGSLMTTVNSGRAPSPAMRETYEESCKSLTEPWRNGKS